LHALNISPTVLNKPERVALGNDASKSRTATRGIGEIHT